MKMTTESGDRTEKLLALLLLQSMKGSTAAEKASQLSIAGFTAVEIADMLNTTAAVIRQLLYKTRKSKRRKSK
jgi:hypothetical protein